MKSALIVVAALCSSTIALGQSTVAQPSSKEVMQQFLQYVTSGSLLTRDGWNKAGQLFVHPSRSSRDQQATVVADDSSTQEIWARGNQAEFYVTYQDLGKIDSLLGYRPPDPRYPKIIVRYHLVLTDKNGGAQSKGNRKWKIENPQGAPWVGLQAAIQYVKDSSLKATDPSARRNANATLIELKRFQSKPSR